MGRQHYIMFSSILKPVSAFPAPALYVNVCNHMCGLFLYGIIHVGSYMRVPACRLYVLDHMCGLYIYGFYVSDHMCGLCVCNHMCKIICMGSFHVSLPLEGQEQWGERGSISRASSMTSGLCSLRRSAWGDPSLWIQEHTLHEWALVESLDPGIHGSMVLIFSSFSLGLDLPSRFLLHLEPSIPQLVPAHFPWEGQLHMSLRRPLEPKTPLRVPGHKTPPH